MSNYNSLKTTIDANIKQNGRQEITGQILNSVLNQMVTTLGTGYQFMGVATKDTNPGTPDAKVFYIANGKGTYTNFGGINVTEDEVVVLYWDTAWHKEATGIATQAKLTEFGQNDLKWATGFINYHDGILYDYNNYHACDYIDISGCKKITIVSAGEEDDAGYAFYNEQKEFISGNQISSHGFITKIDTNVPNAAKYIRFTFWTTDNRASIDDAGLFSFDFNQRITNLNLVCEKLSYNSIKSEKIVPELTKVIGYYINDNGVIISNPSYWYSQSIQLTKNERLKLYSRDPSGSAVARISRWSEDGNVCLKVISLGTTQATEFEYLVENDVEYIRFCGYNDTNYSFDIQIESRQYPQSLIDFVDTSVKSLSKDIIEWEKAFDNVLCLGDSLTEGAYYGVNPPFSIDENYPHILNRLLKTPVTNNGRSGYSASNFYTDGYIDAFPLLNYKTFIIWFGTNNGLTDTLDTDVDPYSDYNDYAETETGYYCKIIGKIKEAQPNCCIILMKVFAGGAPGPSTTNIVIDKIAAKFNCLVIDNSDLGVNNHPELHLGIDNPHFGKAGNIYIAQRIANFMREYIENNPLNAEFSVKQLTDRTYT